MSQEKYDDIVSVLGEMGLTDLEAVVYCYLVENSPATPYRVAQEIGKPVANTYKTVQALYQKGLVHIDDTQSRLCQAVPPLEVLSGMKTVFMGRYERASRALAELKTSKTSERIFSLATAEQVFDRCRKLIEGAESVVLVDAYPGVVSSLGPWLETAAGRGITVVLQAYAPVKLKGVEVVPFVAADKMLKRWSGNWLIVVVDGAEYLFAYLSDDGRTVSNAIWCGSAFLALPQHSNLAMSFRACILEQMLADGASADEMKRVVKRTAKWQTLGKRGYNDLAAAFSDDGKQ